MVLQRITQKILLPWSLLGVLLNGLALASDDDPPVPRNNLLRELHAARLARAGLELPSPLETQARGRQAQEAPRPQPRPEEQAWRELSLVLDMIKDSASPNDLLAQVQAWHERYSVVAKDLSLAIQKGAQLALLESTISRLLLLEAGEDPEASAVLGELAKLTHAEADWMTRLARAKVLLSLYQREVTRWSEREAEMRSNAPPALAEEFRQWEDYKVARFVDSLDRLVTILGPQACTPESSYAQALQSQLLADFATYNSTVEGLLPHFQKFTETYDRYYENLTTKMGILGSLLASSFEVQYDMDVADDEAAAIRSQLQELRQELAITLTDDDLECLVQRGFRLDAEAYSQGAFGYLLDRRKVSEAIEQALAE